MKWKKLLGTKCGLLTVLGRDSLNKWNQTMMRCRCECGTENVVRLNDLRRGRTITCGDRAKHPLNRPDLVGKRFGKLTVLAFAGHQWSGKANCSTLWKCRCDCGKECVKRGHDLMTKDTKRRPKCTCVRSGMEDDIASLLDKHGIEYQRQYKFPDCRHRTALRFDFGIFAETEHGFPEMRMIEVQGPHHYLPMYGDEQYEGIVERDKIKVVYCDRNRIKLLKVLWVEEDFADKVMSFCD